MHQELLTIPEFCEIAKIGRTSAYKLLNRGSLKAVKLGKKTLIPRDAVHEWIATLAQYSPENKGGKNVGH